MLVEWYWRNKSGTYGPLTEEELIQLAADGEIGNKAEVRLGEDGRWYPARKVKGLFSPIDKPQRSPADESAVVSQDETIRASEESKVVKLKRAKPIKAKVRPVSPVTNNGVPPSESSSVGPSNVESTPKVRAVSDTPSSVHSRQDFPFPANAAADPSTSSISQRRRKSTNWGVIALVGCGLVGIGLAFAVIVIMNLQSETQTVTTEESVSVNSTPASNADAEVTPPKEENATSAEVDLLRAVTKFRDASTSQIRLGNARVQVKSAWIEAGEDGTSKSNVVVQVEVTNTSDDTSWSYSSFNGTGANGLEAQASMFSSNDKACELIATDKRKASHPTATTIALAPQQAARDTLVFSVPSSDVGTMRLVLPRAGIGVLGAPMGFELPKMMLNAGGPVTESATTPQIVSRPAEIDIRPKAPVLTQPATDEMKAPTPATEKSEEPATPANGSLPATKRGLMDSIENFKSTLDDD